MASRDSPSISKDTAAEIQRYGSDEGYAPLIMDLVAHPKGTVSLEELIILNPETSEGTLQERLDTLAKVGVLATATSTRQSSSDNRLYYYLTETARAVFTRNQMFSPDPLKEMFNRLEHTERFCELLEKPRPKIDAKTVDLNQNQVPTGF
ncbi:hypothetical protein KY092_05330 [Natronomonas gomsonensis]|uniref:hypothetical protein n=1 Tax=Natronomonas gomsonensis TaxID=1046043 RepID=UPI0020CA3F79|nr:hypothetical protein [Natronomonas gomsonensis]MCY4729978.1 hypothetical protein [Natronomonas gomsonensis]